MKTVVHQLVLCITAESLCKFPLTAAIPLKGGKFQLEDVLLLKVLYSYMLHKEQVVDNKHVLKIVVVINVMQIEASDWAKYCFLETVSLMQAAREHRSRPTVSSSTPGSIDEDHVAGGTNETTVASGENVVSQSPASRIASAAPGQFCCHCMASFILSSSMLADFTPEIWVIYDSLLILFITWIIGRFTILPSRSHFSQVLSCNSCIDLQLLVVSFAQLSIFIKLTISCMKQDWILLHMDKKIQRVQNEIREENSSFLMWNCCNQHVKLWSSRLFSKWSKFCYVVKYPFVFIITIKSFILLQLHAFIILHEIIYMLRILKLQWVV